MARFKAEVQWNTKGFNDLVKRWPDLMGKFLGFVGATARNTLKKEYLSGQEIDLQAYPLDKAGRYTITSNVNARKTAVKIYSYPVNLFERGRTLRSGKKEAGKYIITRKLKNDMQGRLQGLATQFESTTIERVIKEVGLQ